MFNTPKRNPVPISSHWYGYFLTLIFRYIQTRNKYSIFSQSRQNEFLLLKRTFIFLQYQSLFFAYLKWEFSIRTGFTYTVQDTQTGKGYIFLQQGKYCSLYVLPEDRHSILTRTGERISLADWIKNDLFLHTKFYTLHVSCYMKK